MLQRGRTFSRKATRTAKRGLPRFRSRAAPPHGRVRSHPTRRRRSSATTAVATCPRCVLHVASTCPRCVLRVACCMLPEPARAACCVLRVACCRNLPTLRVACCNIASSGGPDPRSAECLFVAPHRVLLRAAELNKCSRSENVRCVRAYSSTAVYPCSMAPHNRCAYMYIWFIYLFMYYIYYIHIILLHVNRGRPVRAVVRHLCVPKAEPPRVPCRCPAPPRAALRRDRCCGARRESARAAAAAGSIGSGVTH